jgi:hypothetical protein
MEMVQAIFLRQQATAGRNYHPLPTGSIFMNYACLGGGETGDKETGRKPRFTGLEFEKPGSAIVTPTIDITKKSSSNSTNRP